MKSFSVVLAVAMLLIGTAAMAADTTPPNMGPGSQESGDSA
jgi:hypothetical protein